MCHFKFNFLLRGQLESINLDRIFLPLLKILPCYEGFLVDVTLFLPLLFEYCAEIILKPSCISIEFYIILSKLLAPFLLALT